MNPAIFNKILLRAWREFIVKSNATVVKAFATCGLHPLNPDACRLQPGASTIGAMFSGNISADLVQNPADKDALPMPLTLRTELVSISSGDVAAAGACATGPAAAVLIRKAALDWFITPLVKDAATTAREVGAYKRLRSMRITAGSSAPARLSTAMPSTLEGCQVRSDCAVMKKCEH